MFEEWKLGEPNLPPNVWKSSIAKSAPVVETTGGLNEGWSSTARTHASGDETDAIPSAHPVEPPLLIDWWTTPTTASAVWLGFAVFHDCRYWASWDLIASKFVWLPQNFPLT